MSSDVESRNEHAARKLIEDGMNKRNVAVIDEVVDPGIVDHPLWHGAFVPDGLEGKSSFEMLKEYCERGSLNFSREHASVDQMMSCGDKVVSVITTRGERDGRTVSWCTMYIDRFENGKMVESWSMYDRFGMYQQLGLVPESKQVYESGGLK